MWGKRGQESRIWHTLNLSSWVPGLSVFASENAKVQGGACVVRAALEAAFAHVPRCKAWPKRVRRVQESRCDQGPTPFLV